MSFVIANLQYVEEVYWRYLENFCVALNNLVHFLWLNPSFLFVHCSEKLYVRAATIRYDMCRIPVRHFFSWSRRLLTKIFKSAETVNVKFGVYEFGDKGQ